MPQEHASDKRYRRAQLQLLWISHAAHSLASRILSIQPPPWRTTTMTRSEKLPSRSRSALRKRSPCGPAQCKRRHVQTTPRGKLWAFILALTHSRGPLFFFFLRTILGARLWFQRKPPSLPFRPQRASLDSYWLTDRRERLSCGSSRRGQPRNGS